MICNPVRGPTYNRLPECSGPLQLQPGRWTSLSRRVCLHVDPGSGPGGNKFLREEARTGHPAPRQRLSWYRPLACRDRSLRGCCFLGPPACPHHVTSNRPPVALEGGLVAFLAFTLEAFHSGFLTKGFVFRERLGSLPLSPPSAPVPLHRGACHGIIPLSFLVSSPASLGVPEGQGLSYSHT